MTLERWYRHAAVILWPARKHFEVLCDDDSRKVLPVLEQMVARWKESTTEDAEPRRASALALPLRSSRIGPRTRMGDLTRKREKEITGCKILAALGDPGLIGRFLGEVMIKDAAVDPGKSLVEVCQTYGWDTFRDELESLFKNTTIETVERNVRLLEEICLSTPRKTGGLGRALRNRVARPGFGP